MPRLFVGVPAPGDLELGGVRRELEDDDNAKLVDPELYHVTLAFLGDMPEARTDAAFEAIREVATGTPAEEGRAKGLGAFPSPDNARVLWTGIEADRIESLGSGVRTALRDRSIDYDDRHDFHAHLTVARLRDHADVTDLVGPHEATDFGAFPIEQVHLYESNLTPDGPEYEIRDTVELR